MIYTKEQAYAEIVKLVDIFKTNEARLNIEAEAQIENNFIRPFFKYLNWNTENEGLAIPDYEFVLQRTDRYGKRPDYILQLDGQHLLVMDAKQVKLDMHDPRWMNQVYAYAYSTQTLSPSRKIDFAILTDFQEFVVLDCTLYAGNAKVVTTFRILDWRYDDYITQFDTLWELFERDNMRQAARTRGTHAPAGLWACALSPKKVKANRIPPDKAFLMEMDDDKTGWRVRLAKDMKKHNPEADGALITAAVQLLIDRLIFVKALSDREIEDDYLSQLAETVERDGLAESNISWFTACRTIFTKLNEFYNGSIFESRPELEAVTVSNKVVRAVIHDLQPENSSYNFAVLPVEILGTIYERFLGRVVRTTDKQVKIEDKPEVRKAGGVYYTPQYIVNYIVQNTVGKLLEKCRTPEDVAHLKILDPACGSGSFLLGAYDALINWHTRYYSDKAHFTKQDRTVAYHDSDGRVRLTAKLKRQILLNNLYGVDIDRQAVEVTRFSLSLKALEDTRRGELTQERTLFRQTVLPNLSQNIKCGNSLIGQDYFDGKMSTDADELKHVKPFDWRHEFPSIISNGGFDVVIGNPPYDVMEKERKETTWPHFALAEYVRLKPEYKFALGGKLNLFRFFIVRSLTLLKTSGNYGMIVPLSVLADISCARTRQYLLLNSNNLEADCFPQKDNPNKRIFFDAKLSTCIITYTKSIPKASNEAEVRIRVYPSNSFSDPYREALIKLPDVALIDSENIPIPLVSTTQWELCKKIHSLPTVKRLADAHDFSVTRGEINQTIYREFIANNSNFSRLIKGVEIGQYQIREKLSQGHREWFNEKQFLLKNNPKTISKVRRIATQRITGVDERLRIVATIIEPKAYFADSTNSITVEDSSPYSLEYLLGLLNSNLYQWRFKLTSSNNNVGTNELDSLPIRTINFADLSDKARYDKMRQLVETMLTLNKHKVVANTQADQELFQRQIEATGRKIDSLVYELYGLTPDEIALVE